MLNKLKDCKEKVFVEKIEFLKIEDLEFFLPFTGMKIPEIGVVLDRNLNFTIRVFNLGLANDLHMCKKYDKPAKHINSI